MIKHLSDILGIQNETQVFLLLFASSAVLLALIVFIIILVRNSKRKKKKKNANAEKPSSEKEKKKNILKEEANKAVDLPVQETQNNPQPVAEIKEEKIIIAQNIDIEIQQREDQSIDLAIKEEEIVVVVEESKPILKEESNSTKEKTTEELREEIKAGKERIASREENLRKIQERLKELGLSSENKTAQKEEEKPSVVEKPTYNEEKREQVFDNEGGVANDFPLEVKKETESTTIQTSTKNEVNAEEIHQIVAAVNAEKTKADIKRENNFSNEGGAIYDIEETELKEEKKTRENSISEIENEKINAEESKVETLSEHKIETEHKETNPKTFTEWLNSVSE